MPLVYTREEIKEYLAGRGFDVNNEDIINQFIHDLKKLVKYEDRQRRRVLLGHEAQDTNLESTGLSEEAAVGGGGRRDRNHSINSEVESHGTSARRTSHNSDSHRRHHHDKDSDAKHAKSKHKQEQSSSPRKSTRPHSSHHDERRSNSSRERDHRKNVHLGDDTVDHNRHHNRGAGGQRETKNTHTREQVSPKYMNTRHVANQAKETDVRSTTRERQPLREQNAFDFNSDLSKPTKKDGHNGMVMSRKTLRHENGKQVIEETEIILGTDGSAPSARRQRPCTAPGAGNFEEHERVACLVRPKTARRVPPPTAPSLSLPHCRLDGSEMLRILGKILEEDKEQEDEFESIATSKTIRGPPNRVKRDPVALYHYYKKYWDKIKIPGEDRHMQTRWNVRAQTVGNYPCFEGHPVNYLTRI